MTFYRQRCPVPECSKGRATDHVMCRACWFKVPKPLRDEVCRRWGVAPFTDEYFKARQAAIDAASAGSGK